MSSPIHIGSIIRDELRRQGKTNAWFANEINVNPRTVNKIFLKGVIDTHQLLLISQALGVDFFKYYSAQL
jgi:plasmid maintenance system antidote protein VapI